jgi:hypothetical protein
MKILANEDLHYIAFFIKFSYRLELFPFRPVAWFSSPLNFVAFHLVYPRQLHPLKPNFHLIYSLQLLP